MTERNGPTVHIHPAFIPLQHFADRKRLRGKRFVGFDKINIRQLPANSFQATSRRVHRRNAHQRRINPDAGKGTNARQHG
ncbi:hypothetical protein D3C73_1448920 [compost metagenome]